MKGLLLKDFYLLIKKCKYIFLLVVIYIAITLIPERDSFFNAFSVIFAGMIPYTLLTYDERDKWDRYVNILPVSKAQIVASKYIIGIIVISVVVLLNFICLFIKSGSFAVSVMNVSVILFIGVIFPSFSLPIIFKFGFAKGKMISTFLAAIIAISTAVCSNIAFVDALGNEIPIRMNALNFGLYLPVILFALSAVIYALSYLISVKIYEKREIK